MAEKSRPRVNVGTIGHVCINGGRMYGKSALMLSLSKLLSTDTHLCVSPDVDDTSPGRSTEFSVRSKGNEYRRNLDDYPKKKKKGRS